MSNKKEKGYTKEKTCTQNDRNIKNNINQRNDKSKSPIKKFAHFLKPYRATYIIAILSIVVYAVLNAIDPSIEGLITTRLLRDVIDIKNKVPGASVDFSYIIGVMKILVCIYLGKSGFNYLAGWMLTSAIQNTIKDLRTAVDKKIRRLPISYFDKNNLGDTLSKVSNDIDNISTALQQSTIQIVNGILIFSFAIGFMFYINVQMAWFAVAIIPCSYVVSKIVVKKSQSEFNKSQDALGMLNGTVEEMYSGFNEIKLYGKEDLAIEEFEEANDKLYRFGFKAQFISSLMNPLISILTYFAIIAVAFSGALNVVSGRLTIGNLQAFIRYIWQVNQPLSQVTQLSNVIQSAYSALKRVTEFLDEEEMSENICESIDIAGIRGDVSFENVEFGYNKIEESSGNAAKEELKEVDENKIYCENCSDSNKNFSDDNKNCKDRKQECKGSKKDCYNCSERCVDNYIIDLDSKAASIANSTYASFEDENEDHEGDHGGKIIENLNAEVKAGQMVAIVGPTGAGKTTLINLLMRFYDVDGGSIKIDGIDIRDMNREELRSIFGMVLQDTWLFNGSICDNIGYGREGASKHEVVEAAKMANIDHFIKTLPGGYGMFINEEGTNISTGEKQLLTIARAFLSNPRILILDEATSSVDTRLELLLQEAMKNIMQDRTSFVIAHRLSTIKNADLILVMSDGTIVEQGTHEELMRKGGQYEDLYNSQFANE